MKKSLPSPAARQFAAMALAGCASLSSVYAAQTLRYNFESVTDINSDLPVNLAPGATENGTFANPAKLAITTGDEVVVGGFRYQLGKSLQLINVDAEEGSAGHIATGLSPTGWLMANGNTWNRNYTAMAWVKFESTTADNMVFGQLTGDALHLGSRNGNFHSGHWGDDIGPDQGVNIPTGTGTWQHVAWVNNGNAQSIYRNGVLIVGPGATGASGGSPDLLTIGTFRNNGSFIGSIDEVKIFGDEVLTPAQIQTEMTNTLTAVTIASVTSARLNNTGYTFTIGDFLPGSVTNPATVVLEIDGSVVTPTSVTKTGTVTTVIYNPAPPRYPSRSAHTYLLTAKDQSNPAIPNISGSGTVLMPMVPPSIPGPAGTVGTWGVREYRAELDFGGNWNGNSLPTVMDTLAALPSTDPDNSNNKIFDGTAPVMNHTDPDQPGGLGNFNNDLPYIGHVAGTQDNNIAFVGKTTVTIPAAGSYTFSVHSDDGFALRISGGPVGNTSSFVSSNRNTATNGIDTSDAQTIFFTGGTGDSSTTGVYNFSAPGTYDVLFVSQEGDGGSYYEVAWAQGAFLLDRNTATWQLLGSPNDPAVLAVPFVPRFITNLPGPVGGNDSWGIRTFLNANTGGTIAGTSNWLTANGPTRVVDDVETFDLQRAYLNLSDNYDAGNLVNQGHVGSDNIVPGPTVNIDNVVTVAKGRVVVPASSFYTFNARGDDGFLLRVKAVTGPHPKFTMVTHPNPSEGNPGLEMSNLNEMYFANGTGDTLTRGIIFLAAGQYDLEYFQWEGGGGFWYELTAAEGQYPHGSEPPLGWRPVGFNLIAPAPATLPQISAAGWTVESTAPGGLLTFDIAGALAALTASGTASTWDAVNFTDPESGGGPASPSPAVAWPRNTSGDDNNYAMRATGNLVVTTAATYRLGYQGDDGGYLIIRGTGGNPNPSWEPALLENATGAGVVEAEDPTNAPTVLNKIRTEVGTGNSRTIGQVTLTPGTYQLESLMYEGGGGSYWGIVGAIEPVTGTAYFPVTKGGVVPPSTNLVLVAPPTPESIPVTNFTYNPANGNFSITFVSAAGTNYQLDYSAAMTTAAAGDPATWNASPSGPTAGIAGTTTITGNIASLQPGNGGVLPVGSPRLFLRVRRL